MKSRLEVAANAAVLVAVVVFLAFFGQQEFDRFHHPALTAQASLVGRTVSLPGVHFRPQSKTLLLAISNECSTTCGSSVAICVNDCESPYPTAARDLKRVQTTAQA